MLLASSYEASFPTHSSVLFQPFMHCEKNDQGSCNCFAKCKTADDIEDIKAIRYVPWMLFICISVISNGFLRLAICSRWQK